MKFSDIPTSIKQESNMRKFRDDIFDYVSDHVIVTVLIVVAVVIFLAYTLLG